MYFTNNSKRSNRCLDAEVTSRLIPPVGDGRQVPQKPPRGITRGPPELVIPPPPPYPPPDRDSMDPAVCYREADVTAPTKLVPKRMFPNICVYASHLC